MHSLLSDEVGLDGAWDGCNGGGLEGELMGTSTCR